jgi:O-antigen ligase
MQRYASKGLRYAADRKLNPHNQWLQVGVALGWPGILVFTLAMLSVFRWAYRERQGLALLCAILVMFHAAFESVFEVQRGVVFILWMLMALAPIFRRDRAVQHR